MLLKCFWGKKRCKPTKDWGGSKLKRPIAKCHPGQGVIC
jgi:hypothetical protein